MPQKQHSRTIHPYNKNNESYSGFQSEFAEHNVERWINNLNRSSPIVPGTDSSLSEGAYQLPLHYCSSVQSPPSSDYQLPYDSKTWRNEIRDKKSIFMNTLGNHRNPVCSSYSLSPQDVESCSPEQTTLPVIRSVSPEVPTIGACGGHCPGFEYVCYYILQVIFVVGILTGISLCIAGIVLKRSNRSGNLGVLVYIGCLSSMVCGVLLSVQSCTRRGSKRRKLPNKTQIPLQPIQERAPPARPLLVASLPHTYIYSDKSCSQEEITGVPWWRRLPID